MQKEYWVNVYKAGYGYLPDTQLAVYNNMKFPTLEKAQAWSEWSVMKTIYRIHVKMKEPEIRMQDAIRKTGKSILELLPEIYK